MLNSLRLPKALYRPISIHSYTYFSTKLAFEVSPLGDADLDCTMLEKSLRHGVSCLLGSSGENCKRSYDLISDLAFSQDLQASDVSYIHRFQDNSMVLTTGAGNKQKEQNGWSEEIKNMLSSFEKKDIEAISNNSKLTFLYSFTDVESTKTKIEKLQEAVIDNNLQRREETTGNGTVIGMDISTEFLYKADSRTIDDVIDHINNNNGSGSIGVLSIAVNAFTFSNAIKIINAAKSCNIHIIARDILRLHPRRPGNLTISDKTGHDNELDITEAVDAFKKSMDISMYTEKKFMDEIRTKKGVPKVPIEDLCFGHSLAAAQASLLFPEEWYYLQHYQVVPRLDNIYDQLKKGTNDSKDFVTLHRPMIRILFSAFDQVLLARKQEVVKDVGKKLLQRLENEDESITTSTTTLSVHELMLGAVMGIPGISTIAVPGVHTDSQRLDVIEEETIKRTLPMEMVEDNRGVYTVGDSDGNDCHGNSDYGDAAAISVAIFQQVRQALKEFEHR